MNLKPASTEIAIHDLIAGRWSPRAFSSQPVSREDLLSVLEAARWAPSSYNIQPWRFIVFDRNHQAEAFQNAFETLVPFNQAWCKPVPILIGIMAKTLTPKGEKNQVAAYDAGAASMALVLQAHALGLAAHEMAGFDADLFREKFDIPDDVAVLAMVALGHHGDIRQLNDSMQQSETLPRSRLSLAEFAYEGTWGKGIVK